MSGRSVASPRGRERARARDRGAVQLTPTATTPGAPVRQRDRLGERLARRGRRRRPGTGTTSHAVAPVSSTRSSEDGRLADGRDRLDREQVDAGRPAAPRSAARGRRAGRPRPGRSRRGTRIRRRASPRTARPSRRPAGPPAPGRPSAAKRVTRRRGQLDARRWPSAPPPGRGRRPRSPGRSPGSSRSSRPAPRPGSTRGGPSSMASGSVEQHARRPEPVRQVVAARLELGGEPAVEDDVVIGPDAASARGSPTIVMSSAGSTRALERPDGARRPPSITSCAVPPRADSTACEQPLFLEALAVGRAGVGDAVGVEQHEVAGRQVDADLGHVESGNAPTSGPEPAERADRARRRPDDERRLVAGVGHAQVPGPHVEAADRAVMNSDERRSSTRIVFVRSRAAAGPSCGRWRRAAAAGRRPSAGRRRCPCRSRRR